ncbi:MAG: 4-carboxymuconolactone decarboxylase [Rhodospirillales bacterium]|nr:4-carboxymuconolactone decarboxylase [Rhodospirillales bacterium]
MSGSDRYQKGLKTRSEVLGKAHVERATARATDFDREFQQQITEYCWNDVWNRPGLERKTRSMLNIAMLASLGREDEFKLHVRASKNTGVTRDEVKEILMQVAIYAGVPAANTAFRLAREVFEQADKEAQS